MNRKQTYPSFEKWWESVNDTVNEFCFVLVHANVRSLRKYFNEINSLVKPYLDNIDVIVFSETNIKTDEATLFFLNNFEVFSHNRDGRKGGGVMIMVNQKWKINKSKKLTFCSTEALHIEIEYNNKKTSILGLYRAPHGNVEEFLDDIDNWLSDNTDNDMIVVGDINIDTMKPSLQTNKYLDDMAQTGLESKIYEFTREEVSGGKLTQSCIDHIHIRTKDGKSEGQVISEKVADHYFVAATIADFLKDTKTNNITCSFINNKKVDQYIQGVDWNEVAKERNPDKLYDNIVNIFKDIYAKATQICSTKNVNKRTSG